MRTWLKTFAIFIILVLGIGLNFSPNDIPINHSMSNIVKYNQPSIKAKTKTQEYFYASQNIPNLTITNLKDNTNFFIIYGLSSDFGNNNKKSQLLYRNNYTYRIIHKISPKLKYAICVRAP